MKLAPGAVYGWKFLLAGGRLALANFLVGMSGLVYFDAINGRGEAAGAAYGTALTFTAAITMLGSGLSILVVQRFGRRTCGNDQALERITVVACVVTFAIAAGFLLAGMVVWIVDPHGLTGVAYWSRVPGLILAPIGGVITGLLMARGRESTVLRAAVENFGFNIAAAVALGTVDLGTPVILLAAGAISTLLNAFTCCGNGFRSSRIALYWLSQSKPRVAC